MPGSRASSSPRPAARRPDRYAHLLAEERGLHRQEGARSFRQLRPRRRDQPFAGQGAVGTARGHAGAPGDHRREHLPAAAAVPGAGHAEPPRAGGNLPAARGAGGPFHAQGPHLLPQQAGGARDRAHEPRGARKKSVNKVISPEDIVKARKVVEDVYMDEKIEKYIIDIIFATREPAEYNLQKLQNLIAYGGSPRASISLARAARALRLHPPPRIRHPRGRARRLPRRAAPPHRTHL